MSLNISSLIDNPAPSMEVKLPLAKISVMVKGMLFSDECSLKSTVVTNDGLKLDVLTKFAYNRIIDPPKDIDTFDKFKSVCTSLDRDAILLGIFGVSFGSKYTVTVKCDSCKHENTFDLDLTRTIVNTCDVKKKFSVINKRESLSFPVKNGTAEFIASYPTLKDEDLVYKNISDIQLNSDKFTDLISYIDEFKYTDKDGESETIRKDEDIYNIAAAINSLTPGMVKDMIDKINNTFKRYRYYISTYFDCANCKSEINIEMAIFELFFREIL